MNRKEISIMLENYIQDCLKSHEYNVDSGFGEASYYHQTLESILNYLQQPVTLADFLGWEEGVEYKVNNNIMKITNDGLEIYDDVEEWFDLFDGYWTNDNIIKLRNAKKAEPKRYYAKIKGWELVANYGHKYWNCNDYYNRVFVSGISEPEGFTIKLTKSEWNKLGINDTNADFEEIEKN